MRIHNPAGYKLNADLDPSPLGQKSRFDADKKFEIKLVKAQFCRPQRNTFPTPEEAFSPLQKKHFDYENVIL
jgi:hypothetical protein